MWDAGEDEEVYQHSQSEGGAWRDMWYKKICGFDTVARHPTVLCGWITGREAQHMESLDEKIVGEVCVRCVSGLLINQVHRSKVQSLGVWERGAAIISHH